MQISIRDFNRRWSLGGFNDDQERIGDIFARKEPSTARLASFAVTKQATIPTRTFGTAVITELPRLAKTRLVSLMFTDLFVGLQVERLNGNTP